MQDQIIKCRGAVDVVPERMSHWAFRVKKFEILRRGSPHKQTSSSHRAHMAGESGRLKSRHLGSTKQREVSSKNDGLMGSKNSSHGHL